MKNLQEIKNKVLEKTQLVFIISDPDLPDNPIIYANRGFTELTGYENNEVIGYNCRFLQGDDTSEETKNKLRDAVAKREPVSVEILNYKKSGEPFWNLLHIDPIYLEEEEKHYFVGIQKDITEIKQAEQKIERYNQEIERLSTPVVPIKEGISVLPLIGTIDEARLTTITDKVLPQLSNDDVETLILDLSGFTNLNQEATVGIFQLNDLMKLKGVDLIITGITPKLAMKTRGLDIDFTSLKTYGSVKQAIEAISKSNE
ncbi:PAS domain-containing protein [Salisediminibacterium halotolerans]|uniref:PAS domain S-box-containing protein n=1 Tax=Salisediminibacterium halotolerans TaxID=517425 RepID=A0A1H9SL10_9BACI|nr:MULTISPECIES: STAS domain-containing protein [Salisediminibacterium]RLJ73255.1 PAS domain S-box-containing protein [Actinophytocola xinjiangensis]RPE86677.1 PAS domain S-box-containing protein [Salisediminibacterium halotolerans]TWG34052.1 PAS domain S-box-containing protein [Salisediminibacterium halotolerans]SER85588.1 PAS domain S-box-containing protein [Salisediminibacterium haloalkalitolerans]GEL09179.1 blue-light photoreceptor [Salisediminibacterium halotolerans]